MADTQNTKSKVNPVTKWFNALLGKPVPKETPVQTEQPSQQTPAAVPATKPSQPASNPAEGDSVANDIKNFSKLVTKVSEKVTEASTPIIAKGKIESAQIADQAQKVVDSGKLKKLTTIFVGIIFLLIIIFFAGRLFGTPSGGLPIGIPQNTPGPTSTYFTPTPFDFQEYTVSVYSRDPEILKIEENLKVLDAEVANFLLKDPALNPPSLDFNISF